MEIDLVTKDDLQRLRSQLIEDLKNLLNPKIEKTKVWLRSAEVRKILKISPASLQNLRVIGSLKPVKIGGIYYYKNEEIQGLFEN